MARTTIQERNLGCEVRAVTEGHRARLVGREISVVSDTTPGLHWLVTAKAVTAGQGVIFECRPDQPNLAAGSGHGHLCSQRLGHTPCKHAALAARRLEREGLVAWVGGLWVATDKACPPSPPVDDVDDPFAGFPQW